MRRRKSRRGHVDGALDNINKQLGAAFVAGGVRAHARRLLQAKPDKSGSQRVCLW